MFGSPLAQVACFIAACVVFVLGQLTLEEVDFEPKQKLMFARALYVVVAILAFPGVANVLFYAYFGAFK